MKKIISIMMLGVVATLSSCQDEASEEMPSRVKITIEAGTEQKDTPMSKALYGEKGEFTWDDGDEFILIHSKSEESSKLTAQGAGARVSLSGTIDTWTNESRLVAAIYPYSSDKHGSDLFFYKEFLADNTTQNHRPLKL